MLSNQKLQNALNEIKEITKLDAAIFHTSGKLLAFTAEPEEEIAHMALEFSESMADRQAFRDYQFYKVIVEDETQYILLLHTVDENSFVLGQMAACQIRNLALSYAEQFDRNNFIQNILLGNMLKVDIYSKARKFHMEPKERVVFVIDTGKKSSELVMELVKNLSNMKSGDYVTSIEEHNVVLVKDLSAVPAEKREEEMQKSASLLVDTLHMEAMIKVRVGYGNAVSQIPDLAQSYQEARMALEVGRIFYEERDTVSYGRLGIGRLIYQLPMSLCEMFIKEVFGDEVPAILEDEEAMNTVNKFFENNLNISETARQLYVHRNTLVYRLERIEKAIGLEIRAFDEAMTFRIAIMVLAHMKKRGV